MTDKKQLIYECTLEKFRKMIRLVDDLIAEREALKTEIENLKKMLYSAKEHEHD
jgi:hypothetical protein